MKIIYSSVLVWVFSCIHFIECSAQLTVNNALTPAQLVQDVLLGAGVTVSNITYSGAALAKGTFNGSNSNIGLSSGILLTTGSIFNARGPNNDSDVGTDNALPGTSALDALAGINTHDATILEFDFVPLTDTISFRYVFASEEYNEYVCSDYNDVFAFFISGPGFTGQKNIALIPGTNTPVTINRVNNGACGINGSFHPGCDLTNAFYFIDNDNPPGTSVQYDGFTTVLTAQANVIPCVTYHFRLEIADALDGSYDSGVFLEAGSFSSGSSVNAAANISSGILTQDGVVACAPFTASFINTSTGSNLFQWNFGDGSAVDTTSNPTHTYTQGGRYLVQLIAIDTSFCHLPDTAYINLVLASGQLSPLLDVFQSGICDSIHVLVNSATAGEFLTYSWNFGDSTADNNLHAHTYRSLGTYGIRYLVTDTVCHLTDSLFHQIKLLPRIDSEIFSNLDEGCVPLNLVMCDPNGSMTPYTKFEWTFGNGMTSNNLCDSVSYTQPGTYYARLIVSDSTSCNLQDTAVYKVTATVTPHAFFNLPDSLNMLYPLSISNESENGLSYFWNFSDGKTDDAENPVHEFFEPGYYTICLTTTNNVCYDTLCDVLKVYENPQAIWLPSSFSPNGDGLNDVYAPDGIGISSVHMTIFDRWGDVLFETKSLNNGWDGNYKGTIVENGVYVVQLKATLKNNETVEKMVPLTIIR